ncbi:MAG: LysM peptidoglycan-binding domain-containing protein [Bacteroidota bacterium]
MRKHYLLLLCYFLALPLTWSTADSLGYLTPKDTIFITLGEFQEKLFDHQVMPQQTLYSIAKFYGLTLEELFFYNPQLEDTNLAIGQHLRIPIPNRAILRYKNKTFQPQNYAPICYVVKRHDTLFRIAKVHFRMPLDSIIVRNQLQSEQLSVGQILHIGWMSIEGIPDRFRKFRGHPEYKQNQRLRNKYVKGRQVKKEWDEQGVAFWQKDGAQQTDFYALHRKAPINSIIAITNPMNGLTMYAKVIGRIPDAIYGEEVVTVVSSKTAKALQAKDKRFFVRLRFLK